MREFIPSLFFFFLGVIGVVEVFIVLDLSKSKRERKIVMALLLGIIITCTILGTFFYLNNA